MLTQATIRIFSRRKRNNIKVNPKKIFRTVILIHTNISKLKLYLNKVVCEVR